MQAIQEDREMLLRDTDGEEMRLLAEYETAAHEFAWAVRELSRRRQDVSSDDFQKLREITEKAHAECQRTRKAFEEFLRNSNPPASADSALLPRKVRSGMGSARQDQTP